MGTLNETHEATKELFMEIYHEFQEARKAVQTAVNEVNEADLKIAYDQYEKTWNKMSQNYEGLTDAEWTILDGCERTKFYDTEYLDIYNFADCEEIIDDVIARMKDCCIDAFIVSDEYVDVRDVQTIQEAGCLLTGIIEIRNWSLDIYDARLKHKKRGGGWLPAFLFKVL